MRDRKSQLIKIKKEDAVLAWTVLENIAVSLSQIGGTYCHGMDADGNWKDEEAHLSMLKALEDFFSWELCQKIAEARARLGKYIPDEEAEYLSEHEVAYWNYKSVKERPGRLE